MPGIPVNRQRKYWIDNEGRVFLNLRLSGRCLLLPSSFLVPTAGQCRQTLLRFRQDLALSRSQLAVILGVSLPTLRRWETGERKPSTSARKLVRLIELILFKSENIDREFGGMLVGRVDLKAVARVRSEMLSAATPEGTPPPAIIKPAEPT